MKRSVVILSILTVFLADDSFARKDSEGASLESSAVATVTATIGPMMAIETDTEGPLVVDAGQIGEGGVTTTIRFHVSANAPNVRMYVEATAMYRGGDASQSDTPSVPVDLVSGVEIMPLHAFPAKDGGSSAEFVAMSDIDGAPAHKSETLAFESDQAGRFDQDVLVTLTWRPDHGRLPAGKYGARVKLTTLMTPE